VSKVLRAWIEFAHCVVRWVLDINQRKAGSALALILITSCPDISWATGQNSCDQPVYLTFTTGNMEQAQLVADALRRHDARATFFATNEPTQLGLTSMGTYWEPWWKALAAEGNEFASLTYDQVYWRSDLRGVKPMFRVRPGAGAFAGREFTWTAEQYCAQVSYVNERLQDFTGKPALSVFHAPGGKTSPKLLKAAKACGFAHVGWASAVVLGDDLPSAKNLKAAQEKALHNIRPGDILMAHMGSRSHQPPWALTVLDPLIAGLQERGFCFATLRDHPAYRNWIASHPDGVAKH
jgi:peptidoglycan/xylan/chitin deacetylase (PgdA/CDA1 family)